MTMLMLNDPGWRPQVASSPANNPGDSTDSTYEYELLSLIGRMEQLREELAEARQARRLNEALTLARDLMEQVVAIAQSHFPRPGNTEQQTADQRVSEFYILLNPLREQLASLGKRAVADATLEASLEQCFEALHQAVFAYFLVFSRRFSTSQAARAWVEVAATFSVEIKRTLLDSPEYLGYVGAR